MSKEKLTKSKLRKLVREEIQNVLNESHWHDEIKKFLSSRSSEKRADMYKYEGYWFGLDKMGGMTSFVNLYRHPDDSESLAHATIEDDGVHLSIGRRSSVRPDQSYQGPKDVIDALINLVKNRK